MAHETQGESRYMSVKQAARYCGLTEKSLRYKISMRDVPYSRVGHSLRLDRVLLDKLFAVNTVSAVGRTRR